MSEDQPKFEYRYIQTRPCEWSVFLIFDDESNVWRRVAVFVSEARAKSYAEIEQMRDEWEGDKGGEEGELLCQITARELPASRVTPDRMIRRESIAHTRIERTEEISRAAVALLTREDLAELPAAVIAELSPAAQAVALSPPEPAIEATPVAVKGNTPEPPDDGAEEYPPLPEAIDCATLEPLTALQFKVLSAVLMTRGAETSGVALDKASGVIGASTHTLSLAKKGYIRIRKLGKHRYAYDGLTFGAPRVGVYDSKAGKCVGKYDAPASLPSKAVEHRPAEVAAATKPAQKSEPARVAPISISPSPASKPSHARPTPPNGTRFPIAGDPEHGRSALDADDGRIHVISYLTRKGHTVSLAEGGWRVDGRIKRVDEALELINSYRAKAELPPALASMLA